MGIIGIILAIISFYYMTLFGNPESKNYDCEAAIGWGIIGDVYLLAFSIVGVVIGRKEKKPIRTEEQ